MQDTLSDETKTFLLDEKYLAPLGLSADPRLFPKDVWDNTSLPVFVTYVMEGQESQAVGLISNISKILPNNTILIYNLGLGNYGLRTVRHINFADIYFMDADDMFSDVESLQW